jgi:hypothetical protein
VEAIFNFNGTVAFDPDQNGEVLAKALFRNRFMPYAKANWKYNGLDCNCGDLANAFCVAWVYIKNNKRTKGLLDPGAAQVVSCLHQRVEVDGLITRKDYSVFAGPAYGNVRTGQDGMLDGRCLFPVHWICQVGTHYYDPTFNHTTSRPDYILEREISRGRGELATLWFSTEKPPRYLYARDTRRPALQFADSWHEMDARVFVPFQEWKTKTTRSGHTRSANLQQVDAALSAFCRVGYDAFQQLKTAFETWGERDPKEARNVNVGNCVRRLKSFLGSMYPNNLDNL